ncbi:MAG: amino acid permease, partial [Proteobacteria bacterium]|nr:amino acid permease [Pseudomonadota bacterium]
QNLFTVLKLVLVASFVVGGLWLGDIPSIFTESTGSTLDVMIAPSFAVGLIYVTYAYTGWNGSAYLAGEIQNPAKALPRALALGTGLVMLVYLGLNVVFLSAAPVSELSGTIEVGAVAAVALFGEAAGRLLSGVIALLLVSSLSAMIMAGPRIYQSMGEHYPAFQFLARRSGGSGPFYAICFQAIIAVLMLMTAKFDALISYMGFTLSLSAALTVVGVFVLRRRLPHAARPYRCWGYPLTPILFISLSMWMVIFTIIETPWVALSGGATILVGLGLYWLVKPRRRVTK